jgi:VNT family MFS transporter (synaptic vesicle glycoprotein 2)
MQRLNDEDENSLESPQLQHQLIDLCGFGYFQYALLTVCALANASDAVELLSISFILPKILLQFNASGMNFSIFFEFLNFC